MFFHDSRSSAILDQPITFAEANYVLKVSKNKKSTGSDTIVGELINNEDKSRCEMLLTLFIFV